MSNSYFALFDKTGKPASWRFARAALVLWLFSLILPGIYLHSDERGQLGIGMLLVGWLSPLLLNFAWFAKAPFIGQCQTSMYLAQAKDGSLGLARPAAQAVDLTAFSAIVSQ